MRAKDLRLRLLCWSADLTMFSSILVESSAPLELARHSIDDWQERTIDAARSHSSRSLTLYALRGSLTAISLELLHLRTRTKIHMGPRLGPLSRSGAWRPSVKAPQASIAVVSLLPWNWYKYKCTVRSKVENYNIDSSKIFCYHVLFTLDIHTFRTVWGSVQCLGHRSCSARCRCAHVFGPSSIIDFCSGILHIDHYRTAGHRHANRVYWDDGVAAAPVLESHFLCRLGLGWAT